MVIRRNVVRTPVKTRVVREQREEQAAPTSRVSSMLERRRNTIQLNREQRRELARQSDLDIVATPDDGDDLLGRILDKARNEVRHRRPGEYVHVSDLIGKCMRRVALLERHELPERAGRLTLMDLLTFRMGEAVHDVAKERTALGAPDNVWGKWKCKCGHLYHEEPCVYSEVDQEDICERCGTATTEYVEVSMRDEDLLIVGNPDLLLYFGDIDAFHVNEIKSLAHKQWEEISRPKPEHVIQALFYWYLMRKLGYRMTDRITIIYFTKGYVFQGKPYKEFSYLAEEVLHRLDDFLEDAQALKQSREGGELPARTCPSADCPEGRKCEVTNVCFGGEDATITEIDIRALYGDEPAGGNPRRRTRR